MEEELRESACIGDVDTIRSLLTRGANVNAQHAINNWTALHWAAKRGHAAVVQQLLDAGGDATLRNDKNQTALAIASDPTVIKMLGGDPSNATADDKTSSDKPEFVPNYRANPPFPYTKPQLQKIEHHPQKNYPSHNDVSSHGHSSNSQHINYPATNEIVLKIRVANAAETDFFEAELSRDQMTYEHLQDLLCRELDVRTELVAKIRKLPDTVIRKDKDVQRLCDWTELELVLSNKYVSESSRNYKPAVSPRSEDIFY